MMIEVDDEQESRPSRHGSSREARGANAGHARLMARIFRTRMPYAMLSFLAITAAAAVPELTIHPDRASTYAFVYALEAQIWLVGLTLVRSAGLSYLRAAGITLLTTIAMMALITGYHIATSSDAAVLLVTLSYVTVGAMVVFPWRPRAQLIVASTSVVAYAIGVMAGVQTTTSTGLELLALATIAALTVGSVHAAEHYRRRFVQLPGAVREATWRA